MSRTAIVKWCQMFEDCRRDLTDAEREGKTSNSEHTRHGAASGRHYSQQFQSERSTHYIFGKLKEHLGGRQYSNNDQVQAAVLSCLQDQGAIFYRQGIERMVELSDKCLQQLRNYVEK